MKAPVTMNQAQVYGISKQNSEKIFQFFQKNFGCTRKVYSVILYGSKAARLQSKWGIVFEGSVILYGYKALTGSNS